MMAKATAEQSEADAEAPVDAAPHDATTFAIHTQVLENETGYSEPLLENVRVVVRIAPAAEKPAPGTPYEPFAFLQRRM